MVPRRQTASSRTFLIMFVCVCKVKFAHFSLLFFAVLRAARQLVICASIVRSPGLNCLSEGL